MASQLISELPSLFLKLKSLDALPPSLFLKRAIGKAIFRATEFTRRKKIDPCKKSCCCVSRILAVLSMYAKCLELQKRENPANFSFSSPPSPNKSREYDVEVVARLNFHFTTPPSMKNIKLRGKLYKLYVSKIKLLSHMRFDIKYVH